MMKVIEATGRYLLRWDEFVNTSINGTLFNRRDFLSYHEDKFANSERYLLILDNNTPIGQINACLFLRENKSILKSPYGGSYGGIILRRQVSYSEGKEIINALINYAHENNLDELIITPPISCCCSTSLDTLYFNMLEAGFSIVNQDISSVVTFNDTPIEQCLKSKTMNTIRNAIKNDIITIEKSNKIMDFWTILDKNYKKLGTTPTHTFNELESLIKLLPERIFFDIAYKDGEPIAAILYFEINDRVNSSFYLCQDPNKQKFQALSLLIYNGLIRSQKEGYKYFDFGTSTSNMIARPNIFSFKEQFTKNGYFRYTFKCSI